VQEFYAPAGATRLFLGFADAYEFGYPTSYPGYYNDNSGLLEVEFDVSFVPEPGSLLAFGTGIIGLTGIALRRRR